MKTMILSIRSAFIFGGSVAAALLATSGVGAGAAETQGHVMVLQGSAGGVAASEGDPRQVSKEERIIIHKDGEGGDVTKRPAREVTWLGLATEEASEALASQLGLNAGEGLVVTYVAENSPAAKAEIKKNDVLTEFDGQLLVHPAQLRKLVLMHKEDDTVKLTLFRNGQKQTVSVTLGKTKARQALLEGTFGPEHLRDLERQLRDMHIGDNVRAGMENMREALARAGVDREAVHEQVRRAMEEARKAVESALRQATNAQGGVDTLNRHLRELARRGLELDKHASVTVKSDDHQVRTVVKSDDSGTYLIVANPKKHLTVHDKDGKLVFDGEIETTDQQQAVPKDVWEKVKPMLGQLDHSANEPEAPGPPEAEEERSGDV